MQGCGQLITCCPCCSFLLRHFSCSCSPSCHSFLSHLPTHLSSCCCRLGFSPHLNLTPEVLMCPSSGAQLGLDPLDMGRVLPTSQWSHPCTASATTSLPYKPKTMIIFVFQVFPSTQWKEEKINGPLLCEFNIQKQQQQLSPCTQKCLSWTILAVVT